MTFHRFSAYLSPAVMTILASLLFPYSALVAEPSPSTIEISEAWVRLQPPSSPMTAAYMKIENIGASADALISASCDCAKAVELHVMSEKDGMMSMRRVERFDIAAGATKKLEPGGAHLMIMGLTKPLSTEKAIRFELVFEGAGKREISVPVRDLRKTEP